MPLFKLTETRYINIADIEYFPEGPDEIEVAMMSDVEGVDYRRSNTPWEGDAVIEGDLMPEPLVPSHLTIKLVGFPEGKEIELRGAAADAAWEAFKKTQARD